jgi:hypothetical protein
MSYNDEHYNGSKMAYDGELIDAADAVSRYKRDRAIAQKYRKAEENVDDLQMTWDDVVSELSSPMHDPRAGNVGASRPGGPL